ncbi:caspase family protein [Streptomyces sp. NPDC052676]|uniref:caspase family protein n=1 Tax=Streptomyces sp. NPDC052676 TaxID=3154953 RepID=UPI0034140F44
MPLPDPSASRAVLIGVDTYDDLADLPAVANNVERLAALLTADDVWGLPPRHLTVLTNPTSKDDVLDAVHTAATEAEDALLFYFAGHGLLTVDADLRLALPHTYVMTASAETKPAMAPPGEKYTASGRASGKRCTSSAWTRTAGRRG